MYSSVYALPKEVLACLDEADAKVWMQTYNDAFESAPEGLSDKEQVYYAQTNAWMGTRELPSAFSVEEWATVEDVDRDNELVILDKVEEHFDKYIMFGGDMQDTHSNVPLGHVWHSERRVHPETGKDGIVVWYNLRGGTYEADKGRKEWLKGKNRLSIGASASVDGMQCDGTRCYTKRGVRDLYEISLCEVPANPHAEVIEAFVADNMAMAKSCGCNKDKKIVSPLILKTLECNVFNGMDCTLKKVVMMLRSIDVPHNIEASDTVVKARADENNQLALMEAMEDVGLLFEYDMDDDGFIVKHKADTYHKYRVQCDYEDMIDSSFKLTKNMTEEMFNKLYGYGFITKLPIAKYYSIRVNDEVWDSTNEGREHAEEIFARATRLHVGQEVSLWRVNERAGHGTRLKVMTREGPIEEHDDIDKSWYLKRPMEIEKIKKRSPSRATKEQLQQAILLWLEENSPHRPWDIRDRIRASIDFGFDMYTRDGLEQFVRNNNILDYLKNILIEEAELDAEIWELARLEYGIDKSDGAMTGDSAGASNAVYGKIDYKSIQQFMKKKG